MSDTKPMQGPGTVSDTELAAKLRRERRNLKRLADLAAGGWK